MMFSANLASILLYLRKKRIFDVLTIILNLQFCYYS